MTHLARTTDPETSMAAARSIRGNASPHILTVLQHHGPLSDPEIEQFYYLMGYAEGWPYVTPQRLRTARADHVRAGRIVATDETVLTHTGRKAIRWARA